MLSPILATNLPVKLRLILVIGFPALILLSHCSLHNLSLFKSELIYLFHVLFRTSHLRAKMETWYGEARWVRDPSACQLTGFLLLFSPCSLSASSLFVS